MPPRRTARADIIRRGRLSCGAHMPARPLLSGVATQKAFEEREPSRSLIIVPGGYGEGTNFFLVERRGGESAADGLEEAVDKTEEQEAADAETWLV